MPVSATPSTVSGPDGSPVLIDGSHCVPATAAGAAIGTAAIGAAVAVFVDATREAATAIGEGPAALTLLPGITPTAMVNAMPTIATIGLVLFMLDAPLDSHARGVSVSASDGRPCGRPCHDRSVTPRQIGRGGA